MTAIQLPRRRTWFALLLVACLAMPTTAAAAAKITIINNDGPDEGFNDPTPAAPVGGNPGTTRGQQRLIAFQFAADIWGASIDTNTEIFVVAQFDPLGPNVLGAAGTLFISRNFGPDSAPGFPGPEFADTWYHIALANKRAGVDLVAGEAHIIAFFSSDFNFYLGLDNNHGPQNDLVAVLLHEFAHGLGFSNFVTEATGAQPSNGTDIYSQYTLDGTTNTLWSDMTSNAQRQTAALQVDRTAWTGPHVTSAVPGTLDFGRPELTILAPMSLAGSARIGTASFGPPLGAGGITGNVVVGLDGAGAPGDACEPLVNGAAVAGNIAMVDRGTCVFTLKVQNAQNAGAVAVLVADNVAGDPPPGLGGVDPTIIVPSARITLATGNAIKAALASGPVTATLGLNLSRRAGTDLADRALLYATNPVQSGSSISHFDSIAFPNQLMEPAINPDLTHKLIPPFDMTLPQMHDIGWFSDANLDGSPDATVLLGSCDTGTPDATIGTGGLLADQARVWFSECANGARNHGAFVSCVAKTTGAAVQSGIISGAQKGALQRCAGQMNRGS